MMMMMSPSYEYTMKRMEKKVKGKLWEKNLAFFGIISCCSTYTFINNHTSHDINSN